MAHFRWDCWRVRWMIAMVLGVVALRTFGVLYPDLAGYRAANKPVGACLGGIVGLLYVKQAFPTRTTRPCWRGRWTALAHSTSAGSGPGSTRGSR